MTTSERCSLDNFGRSSLEDHTHSILQQKNTGYQWWQSLLKDEEEKQKDEPL
jgi:hypothetical protein